MVKKIINEMKKIDRINNMSLSKLVSNYFHKITKTEISSPILKKNSGIITLKKPLDEYKKHLEKKYLQK